MIGAWVAKRRAPAAFEALNQRDLDGFLRNFTEDAIFVFPGDIAPSGTHRGKDAIHTWWRSMFEQFPAFRFTVRHVAVSNLLDLVGTNVLMIRWDIEATNRDGLKIANSGVTVVRTRGRKVVHAQDYIFDTGPRWRAAWGASE